jgi:hypothetical protein
MTQATPREIRQPWRVMVELGMVFTLDEAMRAGRSEAWVRHALTAKRVVRIRRGFYCDAELWERSAASPVTRHVLEARAAWIAIGRRGWASHYSAALLNGLPVPFGQPAAVTISQANRPKGRRHYFPGVRLRTASVDPRDVGSEFSMPVLRPARTALDVTRLHGFGAGLVLADSALARGVATESDLARIDQWMTGWSGSRAVHDVVRYASPRREAPSESLSFALFVERQLPLPECNPWIVGHGAGGVRSDFRWKAYRLVGEVDGRIKYTEPYSKPDRVLADEKARQMRIEETGLVVVRWTAAEIVHHPDRVIDRIVRQSRVASEIYGVPLLHPGSVDARDR